ncbi:MAG: N-acetylmuramoyl-L-alanine amidase family protein [Akkermansiaceae bacterium]
MANHSKKNKMITLKQTKVSKLICILLSALLSQTDAREISRVIIDPGHGGKDKGAHRGSVYEKDLALKVGLLVEKKLKARGMPVTMTRRSDRFITLGDRAAIANRYSSKSIFVSIHFNAHTGTRLNGVETYYHSEQGQKLAAAVHLRMLSRLNPRNGNTRQRKDLGVLKATNCPAILVECGYISNPTERQKCITAAYQENCAQAIVDGIWAYKNWPDKGGR